MNRLQAEQHQLANRLNVRGLPLLRVRLLPKYAELLNTRRFHADIQADLAASRIFGGETVMSLAYKTSVAMTMVPACILTAIEPSLEQNALLPIAATCAAWMTASDREVRDFVDQELRKAASSPSAQMSPLVARLGILSTLSPEAGRSDPRLASSLFSNFRQIERQAAANEFGAERVAVAADAETAEAITQVVLRQIREEIERNEDIVRGKSWRDVPSLLREKMSIVRVYKPDPRYVLADIQKAANVDYLLGALLTLSLIQEGWIASFQGAEGMYLERNGRRIQPFDLIRRLAAGEISEEEFLAGAG
jgi:hypothetical protein